MVDRVSSMSGEVKWTPELEVALFRSMHGHKPVGLNKHFQMVCIQHKLQQFSETVITTHQIWFHLKSLYDIESLDDLERFPFPNNERDFCLPEEYHSDGERRAPASEGDSNEQLVCGKKRFLYSSRSPSPASSPGRMSSKRKRN